jgi:serine/threonine protein kinase
MWLLLEYCSQGTLAQFLGASARLPDAALWDLAGQLLQALLLFEQHRIVHNDIKPENIFIMEGGIPKIGDLGMARFTSAGSVLSKTPGGTPVFQAPEVLSKEKGADGSPLCFREYASCDVSYQSDVYSVGVVLWSMVMRRNPDHPGGAFFLTPRHVPDSRLRDLINNMLEPDPTKRSCASLYVDLFGCDDARVIKVGFLKKQAFLNIMRERSFALKSGRNPRLFYSAACFGGQTLDTPASFDRCITLSASSTAAVEPVNQTDFILSNVKCVKASSLRKTT